MRQSHSSAAGNKLISVFIDGCKLGNIAKVAIFCQDQVIDASRKEHYLAYGLARATSEGHVDIVQYLLEYEASPNQTAPRDVARSKSKDIIQLLLGKGWDINQQNSGQGPTLLQYFPTINDPKLHYAYPYYRYLVNDEDLLKWCVRRGANPNVCPNQAGGVASDNQLLDAAAAYGTIPAYMFVRSVTAGYGHPLHAAVEAAAQKAAAGDATHEDASRMKMVEFLIDDQALDINRLDVPTKRGGCIGTPLHYALRWPEGAEGVASLLLDRGADPRAVNQCGLDVIDEAERYGYTGLLEMFGGAKLRDSKPWEVFNAQSDAEMALMLREAHAKKNRSR